MKKRIITKREVEEDSSGKKLYEQIEENTDDLSGEASSVITRKLNRCQNCGTPLKNSQSIRGRCAFCPTEVCDACAVTCVCNKLLCSAHSGSVLIQNKPSACCPDCKEALEKEQTKKDARDDRKFKLETALRIMQAQLHLITSNSAGTPNLVTRARIAKINREIKKIKDAL